MCNLRSNRIEQVTIFIIATFTVSQMCFLAHGDVGEFTGGRKIHVHADTDLASGIDIDPITGGFYTLDVFSTLYLLEDGTNRMEDVAELVAPTATRWRAADMRFHPTTGNLFVLYRSLEELQIELREYGREVLSAGDTRIQPLHITSPFVVGDSAERRVADHFTFLRDGSLLFERGDSMVAIDPSMNAVIRTFQQVLPRNGVVNGVIYDGLTDSLLFSHGFGIGKYDLNTETINLDWNAGLRLFNPPPSAGFDEVTLSLDGRTAYFTVGESSRDIYAVYRNLVPEPAAFGTALSALAAVLLTLRRKGGN